MNATTNDMQDQPRPFDLAVFYQSRWWIQPDGSVHELARMRRSERRALLQWLRRHADHFYLQAVKAELRALMQAWQTTDSQEHEPPAALSDSNLLYRGALEWLESTELVRALRGG